MTTEDISKIRAAIIGFMQLLRGLKSWPFYSHKHNTEACEVSAAVLCVRDIKHCLRILTSSGHMGLPWKTFCEVVKLTRWCCLFATCLYILFLSVRPSSQFAMPATFSDDDIDGNLKKHPRYQKENNECFHFEKRSKMRWRVNKCPIIFFISPPTRLPASSVSI